MSMNVLFADDDCERTLAPLARIIGRRPGVSVKSAVTFVDAVEILRKARGADSSKFHSVLLDTILPYDRDGRGAAMSDLGIKLAEQAAKMGVSTIVFLTVVRRDEVEDKFSELKRAHPKVRFGYFDKTQLLAGTELNSLIDFVTSPPAAERTGA